jgi:outer membrane lipoprotein-sorting protein
MDELRRKNMKTRLLALTAAAVFASAAPAVPVIAQSRASASSAADRATLDRASKYLQGLNTARGRFVQTDPNGAVTQGTFYLQRPGKIRFEYDKPSGLVVVADGTWVSVSDQRLKTFDRYAQNQTPLSLFLSKGIDLNRSYVTAIARGNGAFNIAARDPKRPRQGTIQLTFSENPVALREWTVTDSRGRKTRVRLTSITRTGAHSPSLFVLRDPRRR